MNDTQKEAITELRAEWLKNHSATHGDVMNDEGGEYILSNEESDHSDDFQVDVYKIYLPIFTEMDADAWLDANPVEGVSEINVANLKPGVLFDQIADHDPAFASKQEEEDEKNLIDLHEQENNAKN